MVIDRSAYVVRHHDHRRAETAEDEQLMITGTRSTNYEKVRCNRCPEMILRRKGVHNPLCSECKRKGDRDRKREVLHISKRP
jgi:formylmethanofuran dehydrogenase subunit E